MLTTHVPGVRAWIYGSRVKGSHRPNSDLDLVVFADPTQRLAVGNLEEAFEESDLLFIVDLHVWSDLPTSFHNEIEREYIDITPDIPS